MFTLKLYRRDPRDNGTYLRTHIEAVHHVEVVEIAQHTLEVVTFNGPNVSDCTASWYIGERLPSLDAGDDGHWWGWGLLENWEGNTTQHFRPHTYG